MNSLRQKARILSVLLIFLSACTARVEYDRGAPLNGPPSADVININTASVEDLERLPTIGRKTAETIVEFREANGPFRRTEHIMLIRGISEDRFLKIRDFIHVN